MKKITLTKVYISDQDKNGKKFVSSNGKPYKKIAIYSKDLENYASGFIWDEKDIRLNWQAGHTVSVIIDQIGQYTNFRLPKKEDYLEERIIKLEEVVFPKGELKDEDIPIIEDETPDISQVPF